MVIVTLGEEKGDKDDALSALLIGEADHDDVWVEPDEPVELIHALWVALEVDVDVALVEDVALAEAVEEEVDEADAVADAVVVAVACGGEGEGIAELVYEYVTYVWLLKLYADDKRVEPSKELCNDEPKRSSLGCVSVNVWTTDQAVWLDCWKMKTGYIAGDDIEHEKNANEACEDMLKSSTLLLLHPNKLYKSITCTSW